MPIMKTCISILVAFLLLGLRPVYCAELTVGVYGSYDFNTKNMSIFWKPITGYTGYSVTLYRINVVNADVCPQTLTETSINTATTTSTVTNITFTNVSANNRYIAKISGITSSGQSILYTKEFYIWVVTPQYTVAWCPTPVDTLNDLISTIEYSTPAPSFSFGNSIDISTWKTQKVSKNSSYYTINNMVLVNVYKNKATSQTLYSEPSAQAITYTAIPDTPIWDTIKE